MENILKPSISRPLHGVRAMTVQLRLIALAIVLASVMSAAYAQKPALQSPLRSVDPLIGTGGDPQDGINDFPGASMPFGMVQLSPDTEDKGWGYHYIHRLINGFSMTHMSGPGCANEGDVFFTATTGPVVTSISDFRSPYSHKMESAHPGYYQVQLLEWGINAEVTATDRTGVARFTFPAGKPANILLPISHTLNVTAGAQVRVVGDRRLEGFVENHGFCNNKQTYKVFFVMTFSRPFSSYGTWTAADMAGSGKITDSNRSVEQSEGQNWVGAYTSWAPEQREQIVTAEIGISYVDLAGAEKNLQTEAETKDFDTVLKDAETAWSKELGAIEVHGGTAVARKIFYTALYHSLLVPSLFSDSDGRYLGFDHQVHTVPAGHSVYANFSGWDIYRSEYPLLAMIEPRRVADMCQSIVLMYQQGGWIDRWPQINLYTNDMVGSPLTIMLATAWLDGIHDFDINTAWEGMLKDATEAPPPGKPYIGEQGVEWINKIHYLPADQLDYGTVAKTQEYTVAYAALYRLAAALGKTSEAKMLHERALYYRNLFHPQDRFFRPRNADGTWSPDFNPALDGHGFVEGTGWHYQSYAPADMAWLINATGKELFNQRMTEFFDYPAPGWYAQKYNSYNETDMQAPFVFNFSGKPWESQRVVRRVLSENYLDSPEGVPGNDDLGAMSSWAVLSMMGIYSVDPPSLAYELVGPSFPKVVIHLQDPYPGKTFTIESSGNPGSQPFIQDVTLNGRKHAHNWISFNDIRTGGMMHFTLSSQPNRAWGSATEDAPPSLSDPK
jgi:predicted alpha-1,2-mannosidase